MLNLLYIEKRKSIEVQVLHPDSCTTVCLTLLITFKNFILNLKNNVEDFAHSPRRWLKLHLIPRPRLHIRTWAPVVLHHIFIKWKVKYWIFVLQIEIFAGLHYPHSFWLIPLQPPIHPSSLRLFPVPLVPLYGMLHHWHRLPPFWAMTKPWESV